MIVDVGWRVAAKVRIEFFPSSIFIIHPYFPKAKAVKRKVGEHLK
jgi:hypothetical protein